jgi:hypothetical protein
MKAARNAAGSSRERAEASGPPPVDEMPQLSLPADAPDDVTVRRARPSDVPTVLLLMQRAAGGTLALKRADLLRSMAERSYLIGQQGTEISSVMGWAADGGVARIERFYVHPPEAILATAPFVLAEIERTANELICESILAFPPAEGASELLGLLRAAGYEQREADDLPRVWRQAVDESQPAGTDLLVKVLRNVRVA